MSNDIADEISVDDLLMEATLLLRDANRWRKLEMLVEKMIDHEPRWRVYSSMFEDCFLSVEEMCATIDKIDAIAPSGDRIGKDQD